MMEQKIMSDHEFDPGAMSEVDDALETMDAALEDASAEEIDPARYRDLTKAEVLEGVADGVRDFLKGNFRPADECYDELGWQLSDDET